MATRKINLRRLRSVLSYDPVTGVFLWLVRRRSGRGTFTTIGDEAGFIETLGYRCIGLNGRVYKAHRLAWLFVYGEWPRDDIDHINGDRADNRIDNLRIGGKKLNARNAKRKSTNLTGLKGVTRQKGGFIARIGVNYERIYLGNFRTAQAAHQAYVEAADKYFGEFARIT